MRRVILTGMVIVVLVVAALPAATTVAYRNFLADSTYSNSARAAQVEDYPGEREKQLCRTPWPTEEQQEVCPKTQNRYDP